MLRKVLLGVILATSLALITLFVLAPGGTRLRREAPRSSPGESGYTVSMSPVGRVEFERVPKRVVTLDANYNDMVTAYGRQRDLVATGYAANRFDGFYAQLEGVDLGVDEERLRFLYGQAASTFDKETLYALDADVHHIDPRRLARNRAWSVSDIDEVARNVAPFFANRYSRTRSYPGDDPYRFYTLWELGSKVGEVYRDAERIHALEAIASEMTRRIQSRLPPEAERPTVGLVLYARGGFMPFSLSRPGFGTAQYRAVGAKDAFRSIQKRTYADAGRGTRLDFEALLTLDPDILIAPWAVYQPERFAELQGLGSHPLGRRLKAVRTGRVHPGGSPLQGPLFHLFQIEMAAKQIYPELFGPFRADHRYPKAERLFDRERVVAVLGDEAPEGRR